MLLITQSKIRKYQQKKNTKKIGDTSIQLTLYLMKHSRLINVTVTLRVYIEREKRTFIENNYYLYKIYYLIYFYLGLFIFIYFYIGYPLAMLKKYDLHIYIKNVFA